MISNFHGIKGRIFLGFVFLSQPYSLFFSWEFILPTFSLGLLLLFFLTWPYLQFTPLCLKFFRSPIQPIKLPVKSWMEKISSHGLNRPNYSWRVEEKWSMFWGLSNRFRIWNLGRWKFYGDVLVVDLHETWNWSTLPVPFNN